MSRMTAAEPVELAVKRRIASVQDVLGIGGIDAERYERALAAGRVEQDIPVNHSEFFAPVIEPTLSTGTQALVVAALAYLAK